MADTSHASRQMRFTLASLIFILFYAAVLFASLRQANVYWERALELASYTAFATAILVSVRLRHCLHYFAFGIFGFVLTFGPRVPADGIDALAASLRTGTSRSMFLHSLVQTHLAVVGATFAMFGTRVFSDFCGREPRNYSRLRVMSSFMTWLSVYLAVAYFSLKQPNRYWEVALEFGAYASYAAAAVVGVSRGNRGTCLAAYALFGFAFHFGPIVPYWLVDGIAFLFDHDPYSAWEDLYIIVGALFGMTAGALALLATHAIVTVSNHRTT